MLNFIRNGDTGSPVIILHGLFGSSKNWSAIARQLAKRHTVYSIDQRNHGDSQHFESHSLQDLVNDLIEFIQQHRISKPMLLGHSMGGMVAMSLVLSRPQLISELVVVDIAPRSYEPHHDKEFAALELNVSQFENRRQLNDAMCKIHPSAEVRQFLQMNLKRSDAGYKWKINVPVLKAASLTSTASFNGSWNGPALFIAGENSPYIQNRDHIIIKKHFPNAQIHTIPEAGHWMHYSHQSEFIQILEKFYDSRHK